MSNDEEIDYNQPVAFDTNGRPLYAHPPEESHHSKKDHAEVLKRAVHIARAAEPEKQSLSAETVRKHMVSKKRYPKLNLTEGEYVIAVIKRHPVGLFLPMGLSGVMLVIIFAYLINYSNLYPSGKPTFNDVASPAFALVALILLISYIIVVVYSKNRLILTNESVIQETQSTLFAHHEQTVSLANVEDVSYTRNGIVQSMIDYGTVRLSTEGEETTYVFNYVASPKSQTRILHNAVEAFKNGRPIEDD